MSPQSISFLLSFANDFPNEIIVSFVWLISPRNFPSKKDKSLKIFRLPLVLIILTFSPLKKGIGLGYNLFFKKSKALVSA